MQTFTVSTRTQLIVFFSLKTAIYCYTVDITARRNLIFWIWNFAWRSLFDIMYVKTH